MPITSSRSSSVFSPLTMHSRVFFMSQIVRSIRTPVASQPWSCVAATKHFFALRGRLQVAGERRAHRAEEDRGDVAPLGRELVGVRPVVGRTAADHGDDDAVRAATVCTRPAACHGGHVGDRLGVDLQITPSFSAASAMVLV